jgi:hypothetical protein
MNVWGRKAEKSENVSLASHARIEVGERVIEHSIYFFQYFQILNLMKNKDAK